MLRTAPLEQLERPIEIGRLRRRLPLRLAPAMAAMAVTVVGLGSILASSDLRSRSVSNNSGIDNVSSRLASVDTINLTTARALAKAATTGPVRASSRAQGSLR